MVDEDKNDLKPAEDAAKAGPKKRVAKRKATKRKAAKRSAIKKATAEKARTEHATEPQVATTAAKSESAQIVVGEPPSVTQALAAEGLGASGAEAPMVAAEEPEAPVVAMSEPEVPTVAAAEPEAPSAEVVEPEAEAPMVAAEEPEVPSIAEPEPLPVSVPPEHAEVQAHLRRMEDQVGEASIGAAPSLQEQTAIRCFWPRVLFAAVMIIVGFLLLRSDARREAVSSALSAMWRGEQPMAVGQDQSGEINIVTIEQEKFRDDHGDTQGGQDNPYYRHPFTRH
jgi:hypothetical protein